jgi:hypothetical protein
MNRLYQWFHARATWLVAEKTAGGVIRITRTEVRVEQEQRLWQIRDTEKPGATACPTCGHTLAAGETITDLCPHQDDGNLQPGATNGLRRKDHKPGNQ